MIDPNATYKDPRYYSGASDHLYSYMPEKPKEKKITIWMYVEDTGDAKFWEKLFYMKNREQFDLRFSCDEEKQGKLKLIKMIDNDELGPNNIVLMDSDFDYILQHDKINDNEYVFQTYTCSIENHYYHTENISEYCRDVSELRDGTLSFNFNAFFQNYSRIIFDLFVCMLCICKNNHNRLQTKFYSINKEIQAEVFGLTQIIDEIKTEFKEKFFILKNNEDINEAKKIQKELEEIIVLKLQKRNELHQEFINTRCDNLEKATIYRELNKSGVYPDTIYSHINGHALEDSVVSPLLNLLLGEILIPIRRKLIIIQERRNKFNNHLKKYKPLGKGLSYHVNPSISIWTEKIQDDFDRFLNDPNNRKEWITKPQGDQTVQQTTKASVRVPVLIAR